MGNSYKYPFINKKEFQSLLFYQGASDHIELDPSESVLEDFYSIDNGYETINMLLFPGIENEKARLQIEKRDKISDKILNQYWTNYWRSTIVCILQCANIHIIHRKMTNC